jgi:hypothetical protein
MEAAYIVAVFAILFSASSALTLMRALSHFDPPEVEKRETAAV